MMELIYLEPFGLLYPDLQALQKSFIGYLHLSVCLWVTHRDEAVLYSMFSAKITELSTTELSIISPLERS